MFSRHLSHTFEPKGKVVSAFHDLYYLFLTNLSSLKSPNFESLWDYTTYYQSLLLCVMHHSWKIFSASFSLVLSYTIPAVISMITYLDHSSIQNSMSHDIFLSSGLVIYFSLLPRINSRLCHHSNCNLPHCVLFPEILTPPPFPV